MIQVCASCNEVIGINLKIEPDMLSHGGCTPCLCKILEESGISPEEIEEFKKEHERR